jgi:glycosyltransferase involved in cell wall biosynthesis
VPVYVLPPGIDPAPYAGLAPRQTPRLMVGWMGSISHHLQHLRSMQVALDCLPALGASFVRLGAIEGDRGRMLLNEVPCRVHQVPWGGVDRLPAKLAAIDVGIIPRVAEPFHEGQSITSGLQYAAAGVPFIATATTEYREMCKLGACSFAVTEIWEWRYALEKLLVDPVYRRNAAENARDIALKEYGLDATGRRYDDLLSSLL